MYVYVGYKNSTLCHKKKWSIWCGSWTHLNYMYDNEKHTQPARLHPIWMLNVIASLRTKKTRPTSREKNSLPFPRHVSAFECNKYGICLLSVGCAEA